MNTKEIIEQTERRVEELREKLNEIEAVVTRTDILPAHIWRHTELRDKTTILVLLRALEKAKKSCNDNFNPYTWVCETRNDLAEALTQAAETIKSV